MLFGTIDMEYIELLEFYAITSASSISIPTSINLDTCWSFFAFSILHIPCWLSTPVRFEMDILVNNSREKGPGAKSDEGEETVVLYFG